jgi:hypothetical protein
MLRTRDIVAIVLALILARMAWNDNLESLSASVHLAFYLPRDKSPVVSPFDVDGDGTSEALAIIKATSDSSSTSWVLQVLDLKPLHHFGKTHLAPFQPSVLFTSQELKEEDAVPLKLTTGQVFVKRNGKSQEKPKITADQEFNERTRKYFCGKSWHDASDQCKTPCPNGQATECIDNERCFADTSCDALASGSSREDTQVLFQLTPGGGLPSLITLWSNGALSLHSLTADKTKNSKQLELREMWRLRLLPTNITGAEEIEWEEANVRFLDAYDSEEGSANNGMVVVSGIYSVDEDDETPFILAVDAMKGSILWDSFSEEQKNGEQDIPLPFHRGTSSSSRRRSRIAPLKATRALSVEAGSLPNCILAFKHSLMEALPYAYWGPNDADLMAIHLDLKTKKDKNQDHHPAKQHGHEHHHHKSALSGKKKWHHRFHRNKNQGITYGRPNVLVTHSQGGLQIRSLKNGRSLCHLSLLEETLYSDLNSDGILDQVQVLLDAKEHDPKDKWIGNLVKKVQDDHEDLKDKGAKNRLLNSSPRLCHAMALSGMPAKEELFSASLCGTQRERLGDHPSVSLESVAPIVVESLNGRRGSRDVIIALNSGMINRLHGMSGRREWQLIGRHYDNFPTWEGEGGENALLTRVQSEKVAPSVRPILLVGENSLAVISVKNGGLLASATFPQTSVSRPVLAEVSGDGTTDVIILTSDGIWGFC